LTSGPPGFIKENFRDLNLNRHSSNEEIIPEKNIRGSQVKDGDLLRVCSER